MTYGFERPGSDMASVPEGWHVDEHGYKVDEREADKAKAERVSAALERLAENTAKEAHRGEGQ